MEKIYLSIIIPAYNEQKRISKTLIGINEYLNRQSYSYEIIVVNDGSKDRTSKTIREFSKSIKNLKLIDNNKNHGKGYVVRQGLLEANGEYRLFMDADNATTISHFEKMIPLFEQGFEVIIGSRDKKDSVDTRQLVSQSFLRKHSGNLGNILIQLFAVPGIWDTQCGFKAFTDEATHNIFRKSLVNRWGFDIEILAIAKKLNYKIGIIPVDWVNDPHSKVSLKSYFYTFFELLKIRWNLIFCKYN